MVGCEKSRKLKKEQWYIHEVWKMVQVVINQIIQTGKFPHHVGIIDKQWI